MIPLSTVPLMGGAPPRGSIRLCLFQGARGDPGGCMRAPCLDSDTRTLLVKKSSGYQHRSPERLAALAAAACRPGVLPGPLPNRELISEPASRLDAFSGYPFRA